MDRDELLRAWHDAGAPSRPSDAYDHWSGLVLAEARRRATERSPMAGADLIADVRSGTGIADDPALLVVEARMRLRDGDGVSARTALSRVLAVAPAHTGARRLRSRVLATLGDPRGSVDDAVVVLDAGDADPDLLRSTLLRLQAMGEWDAAVRLLDRHAPASPELAEAVADWLVAHPDGCASELVTAVLRPPHRLIGDESTTAELEAAMPALLVDVEHEPTNPRFRERLGQAQRRTGRLPDAIETFRTLTDLEPLAEEAWYGLARCEADAGRWEASLASADRAIALNPNSHRARMVRVEAADASAGGSFAVTEPDDRSRLLLETRDPEIAAPLAVLLDGAGRSRDAAAMRAMAGEDPESSAMPGSIGAVDDLVVYTVVTGGYEQPSDPREVLGDTADVVVFTDDVEALPAGMREIARPLEVDLPAQLASRHPKMLPHVYFPDRSRSIYIDANFHLRSDFRHLADGLSAALPMTVLRHSERPTPLEEARLVVERGFSDWAGVRTHFARQAAAGFDPSRATLSYGGFLVRLHHDDRVRSAMEIWWEQFENGVRRDQLSLDHAMWSAGLEPRRLDLHNHRNEHWIRIPHG